MEFKKRIEIRTIEDNKVKDWYENAATDLMPINKGDVLVSLNKKHLFEVVAIFHTYLGSYRHERIIYVKEVNPKDVPFSDLIIHAYATERTDNK